MPPQQLLLKNLPVVITLQVYEWNDYLTVICVSNEPELPVMKWFSCVMKRLDTDGITGC